MTSTYSSNQIHNHDGDSSKSSRVSSGPRLCAPKCFFRMLTREKYSTLGKKPGKPYNNCPNFASSCEFFLLSKNYGEEEDTAARLRDLEDKLMIQTTSRRYECEEERKKGYRDGMYHGWVFGFLCYVLVSMLLVIRFLK